VARVRARVWLRGICGGQSGAAAGFLRVLPFSLPIFIPPISPRSPSSIIRGWYNGPVVAAVPIGLKSHPTKNNKNKKTKLEPILQSDVNSGLTEVTAIQFMPGCLSTERFFFFRNCLVSTASGSRVSSRTSNEEQCVLNMWRHMGQISALKLALLISFMDCPPSFDRNTGRRF
jgi:hypothetical protein